MSPAPRLLIPLWAARQPGRTCDSGKRDKDFVIPLSIKASAPRDIDSYATALPRHQAGRAADVAARRVEAAFWPEGAGEQWVHDAGVLSRAVPDGAASEASDGWGAAGEPATSSEEERPAPDGGGSPVSALRRARLRAEGARRRRAALAELAAAAPGAERRLPAGEGEGAFSAPADLGSPGGAAAVEAPTFSAIVRGLDGRSVEVGGLNDEMEVPDFCDRVADAFQIPAFAVRVMIHGDILHMSQPGVSLRAAGVAEGSQLILVKQWGWSRPDMRMLTDLLGKPPLPGPAEALPALRNVMRDP